ncbi:hypothetical protein [Streptomyces sp. R02]|uniref:Uncharacterized protein n=1 Tax=Streptomyces sp. R02 TaxID=3238623 RepID=A0AB39LV23_9ACTN
MHSFENRAARFVVPAASRRTGPLHRTAPDEPWPSRSPRTRGADRDGAARR